MKEYYRIDIKNKNRNAVFCMADHLDYLGMYRPILKNRGKYKFYFTHKGMAKYGEKTIEHLEANGFYSDFELLIKYIEESEIVYKDKYQVAVKVK